MSNSMGRPSGREVWLEQQLEAYRAENMELTRGKAALEELCIELTRQVNLLDRMRIAAVCRQSINNTKRRNPCYVSARLEARAIDKVVADCEEELEKFRQWRQQAPTSRPGALYRAHSPSRTPGKEVNTAFDTPGTDIYGDSRPWSGFTPVRPAGSAASLLHDITVDLEAGYGPGPAHAPGDQAQITRLQQQVEDLTAQLEAVQTAARQAGALGEVVAVLQDRLIWLEGLTNASGGGGHGGQLRCEEQQALLHENQRLQSELARAEVAIQEVRETSGAAQFQMHRSIKESDAMIEAALAKMADLQEATRSGVADLARHVGGGAFAAAMLRQKVEALQQEIILSDVPDAAPFGSSAARMHDPGLLRRISRHADGIASLVGSLTVELGAVDTKARSLVHSLRAAADDSKNTSQSSEPKAESLPSRQLPSKPFNPKGFPPPPRDKATAQTASPSHSTESRHATASAHGAKLWPFWHQDGEPVDQQPHVLAQLLKPQH